MKYLLRTKYLYDWFGAKRGERFRVDLYFLFTGDDLKLHDVAFMSMVVMLDTWLQKPGSHKLLLVGIVTYAEWTIYPGKITEAQRESLQSQIFDEVVVVTYDDFSDTGKVLVELADEPEWVKDMLSGFATE